MVIRTWDRASYLQKAGEWEVGRKEDRGPGEGLPFSPTPSIPLPLLCALSSLVTGCVASNATPSFWNPVYSLVVKRLSDTSKSGRDLPLSPGPHRSSALQGLAHWPCSQCLSVAGEKK